MLEMKVWSTDNKLDYDPNTHAYSIQEVFNVKLNYERTVEDMTAYDAMVQDLIKVILKHCPTGKLPFDDSVLATIKTITQLNEGSTEG